MKVERLDLDVLEALLPELEDLAHDLGKYLCFEATFVGPDATTRDLRAALLADVRATRRQGAETLDAWAVWAGMRPAELDGDPDLRSIEGALEALASVDLDHADRAGLLAAAALARDIRGATRRLVSRARSHLDAAGRTDALLDDEPLL